jgi:hypothetical protein
MPQSSDVEQDVMMRYLQPDSFDIKLVLEGKLKCCPFCGDALSAIINKVNDTSGVFRSIISCSKCTAQTSYNARDLDEARHGAIDRWQARNYS